MKITKPTEITMIPLDKVTIGQRIRALDPRVVEVLKTSVNEVGAITTPIHVRAVKGGSFELIDGRHRFEVASILGHEEIAARVWNCTKEEARFLEGDANLTGSHLTPLDMAVNLAERKRAYLKMHPEKAAGIAGGKARQNSATDTMSFAEMMGTLLGVTERQIRRIVSVGEELGEEEIDLLRRAPRQQTMNDLAEIAKIGEVEERAYVVKALAEGAAKNTKGARRALVGPKVEKKDPVEVEYTKIATAFANAGAAARKRFVRAHAQALLSLIEEAE